MKRPKSSAKKALLLFLTFAVSLHCAGCAAAPALGMIVGNLLSIGVKFAAMKFAEKSFKKGDSTAGWAAMAAGNAIAPAMGHLGYDVITGAGYAWDRSRADARNRKLRDEASWRNECVCEGSTRSIEETGKSHLTDIPPETNMDNLDPNESQPAKDEQAKHDNEKDKTPIVTKN